MSNAIRGFLLCAMLALLMVPAAPVLAQDNDVDVSYFYDELDQYGRWINHPRLGDVWSPDVDQDWRPYTQGYWSYTEDNGWYWVSDEPFGWAVFHYGRWIFDRDDGWLWIPGTEWAPAWVTWRSDDGDDGYVGWAPLPPESSWSPDGNLLYDQYYYDGPEYASAWVFVRPLYLTMPGMYRYAAPRPQNYIILRRTKHLHAFRRYDRRVFNAGLDVRRFERLVGRPVPRMHLRSISNPREQNFRPGGSDIPVFRPNIIRRPDGDNRRPNFRDRPPGDPGSFVRRTPDGPRRDGPGDFGRDRGGPDRGKGPDFKDSSKGPDSRPDFRDGRKDGPGDRGKGPPGDGPKGANKEPLNQGPGPYKGPAVINEPQKQPPFKGPGFKGPDRGPDGRGDRGPDRGPPDDASRSKDFRDRQGGPKDPSTFKGPPGSGPGQPAFKGPPGGQGEPPFKGPPSGGQNQPAFKGPPSGGQGQSGGPPNRPVTQDQRPQRPPEPKPTAKPPEAKPAAKPPEVKPVAKPPEKKKEDDKKPPG